MNKRVLMIADTKVNLMTCIQIRLCFCKEDAVDLVMGDPALESLADSKALGALFDTVYYSRQLEFVASLSKFLSPKKALVELLGSEPKRYTDIYFWNPDWLIYNFTKYLGAKNVKFHVYTDGVGGYLLKPDQFPKFSDGPKGRWLNLLDRMVWHWYAVDALKPDYYLYDPSLIQYPTDSVFIDIPRFSKETILLLNDIFGYCYEEIKEEYLFLDVTRDGEIDGDAVYRLLSGMKELFGDNLMVRRHPRVPVETYDGLSLSLMDTSIPWELFYLNGGLEGKHLIALIGSATMMPYLMAGRLAETIILKDMIPNSYVHLAQLEKLHEEVAAKTGKIHFVTSQEQLLHTLKKE